MELDLEISRWGTGYHVASGFKQFYRERHPREQIYLPVLALHGSLTQSGAWIALADAADSIRMLCPDHRGFGLSEDALGDSCAEFTADALALAQTLLPERYAVMAHSFACSIALESACMAAGRVAAVVLVDPVVPIGTPPGVSGAAMAPRSTTFATIEEAEGHFRNTEEGKWTDDALRRFVQDIMMREDDSGPWRFPYTSSRLRRLRAFIASPANDYSLFDKAKAVRCPVLVFRGGMSRRFPSSAENPFLKAFPSEPEVVVCPESGHFPTATEPGIIIAELKRFLDGIR